MENKRIKRKELLKSALCGFAVMASLVLLLCFFATFDSAALEVPRYNSDNFETGGLGALDTTDAYTLVNFVIALDRLGYLDTQNFLVLARPTGGSSTRLYLSHSGNGNVVIGQNSTITISNYIPVEFYGSDRRYYAPLSTSISFPIENVLCYKVGDSIVNNVSNGFYTTGTGKLSQAFSAYAIEFTNYSNAILGWNGESYQDGYDAGYSAGQTYGYTAGYGTGYAEGREYGYNEGYEGGYADGFADGESEGGGGATDEELEQEYQRGYEIGYIDGTDYGYQQGYNRAVIDATPNEIDVQELVVSVAAGAREILDTSLGFEIFGFNVAATIVSVIVVLIVAFVVKRLLFK